MGQDGPMAEHGGYGWLLADHGWKTRSNVRPDLSQRETEHDTPWLQRHSCPAIGPTGLYRPVLPLVRLACAQEIAIVIAVPLFP